MYSRTASRGRSPSCRLKSPAGAEASDTYPHLVVSIPPRWRVIRCGADHQWVLQVCDGWRAGAPRWTGRRYCRTLAGLIASCRALCGLSEPEVTGMLGHLPAYFRGSA